MVVLFILSQHNNHPQVKLWNKKQETVSSSSGSYDSGGEQPRPDLLAQIVASRCQSRQSRIQGHLSDTVKCAKEY